MSGGDDSGFEEFVLAHGQALLRTAYLVTGDADRAQDVVQAALERALRSWSRVQAADAPVAYVRRIVVREHLSWMRRRSSGERIGLPLMDLETPDGSLAVDVRDAVWSLLATLPRQQRVILVLRLFEDLSDREIADVLAIQPASVRSQAARALATLRANPALSAFTTRRPLHD